MADNTTLNTGTGGDTIRDKDRAGVKTQIVGLDLAPGGAETLMNGTMPVSGTVTASGPLTDAELRATAVPVSGTVAASTLPGQAADGAVGLPAVLYVVGGYDGTNVQALATDASGLLQVDVVTAPTTAVTGPLTDAQLRAVAVPVSGTVTASGPLTDTQLRATPVPVSGTVTANGAVTNAGTFAVQDSQVVADNAAFSDGTTKVFPSGYVFDEVAGTALTENDAAAARIDSKRSQVGVIEDATTRGQRLAITAANAAKVDGSAVTQPISGTVTINAIPAGTNNIGDVDVLSLPALPAGTNNIGDVDILTIAAGTNAIGNVGIIPRTSGGLTTFHLVSAGSTNATNIKASAGQLFGWYIYNSNAAARKVAFHNTAGTPTAGASIFFTIIIPPTSAANVFSDIGIAFGTGIAITTVTDLTDAGATAVAANDLNINLFYA